MIRGAVHFFLIAAIYAYNPDIIRLLYIIQIHGTITGFPAFTFNAGTGWNTFRLCYITNIGALKIGFSLVIKSNVMFIDRMNIMPCAY